MSNRCRSCRCRRLQRWPSLRRRCLSSGTPRGEGRHSLLLGSCKALLRGRYPVACCGRGCCGAWWWLLRLECSCSWAWLGSGWTLSVTCCQGGSACWAGWWTVRQSLSLAASYGKCSSRTHSSSATAINDIYIYIYTIVYFKIPGPSFTKWHKLNFKTPFLKRGRHFLGHFRPKFKSLLPTKLRVIDRQCHVMSTN